MRGAQHAKAISKKFTMVQLSIREATKRPVPEKVSNRPTLIREAPSRFVSTAPLTTCHRGVWGAAATDTAADAASAGAASALAEVGEASAAVGAPKGAGTAVAAAVEWLLGAAAAAA